MTSTVDAGLARAQEVLFNQGVLMHLYVGKWTGNRKLRQKDLLLDGVNPDVIYVGHKKLLPKEAQARLTYIEGQARHYLDQHSLDFPIGKAKYIYYRALTKVIQRLREFKTEWDAAVRDLIVGYPEFQRQQLERLDAQSHLLAEQELEKTAPDKRRERALALRQWEEEQAKANRELYPTATELQKMYAFEWRLFRVSALDTVDQMSLLEQNDLIEAQESVKRDLQSWVRDASQQIHQTLGEACRNAHRMLEENGRLTPRNLRPLFDAFEAFQSVSFSEGSQFQQSIDRIRQRYLTPDPSGSADFQRTADAVNNSPDELAQLLGTLSTLAVDQVAAEAGIRAVNAGQFGRVLEA